MIRAAALGLLFAGGAQADSSVAPVGEAAAKRRTWGEQCKARFELAHAESAKLEPSFSTGKVELQLREDVLPIAEEVLFGWQHGKPHFRVSIEPLAPKAIITATWRETGPNAEERHMSGHSANIEAYVSFDAERTRALRAIWRDAVDDCMRIDAPLPRASASWAQACVARFAQARSESAAIDARSAAGAIEVSNERGVEHVHFSSPRRRVDVAPESDAAFRQGLPRPFPFTPKEGEDGWVFLPNHPHHSFPPDHYTLHRHERTADLYEEWDEAATRARLEPIWKRAGAECLELK